MKKIKKYSIFYIYGFWCSLICTTVYFAIILIFISWDYSEAILAFFIFIPIELIILPFVTSTSLLLGERLTKNKILIPFITNIVTSIFLSALFGIIFGLVYTIIEIIITMPTK